MKVFIIFGVFCGLSLAAASSDEWTKLSFKFGSGGYEDFRSEGAFWETPNDLQKALRSGWARVDNPNEFDLVAVGWRSDAEIPDYRVLVLYDATGHIVGFQIAVDKSEILASHPPYYDYNRLGVYEEKEVMGIPCITSTLYLTDPATFKNGINLPANRLSDGLWVKNGTSYTRLCEDIKCLEAEKFYTSLGCYPAMGNHYYRTNKDVSCADFTPWFLLNDVKTGKVIGGGWHTFGKNSHGPRNWFDSVTGDVVRKVFPGANECLGNDSDKYGYISMHFYFIDAPWAIDCPK